MFFIIFDLTLNLLQNVLSAEADYHQALDVAHGVPPPRAAPALLRRVVLSTLVGRVPLSHFEFESFLRRVWFYASLEWEGHSATLTSIQWNRINPKFTNFACCVWAWWPNQFRVCHLQFDTLVYSSVRVRESSNSCTEHWEVPLMRPIFRCELRCILGPHTLVMGQN